jgi:hypothetical protein
MSAAASPGYLRPMNVGEILDRAVTLYVRNFVPLTIVALIVVVPMAIAQYAGTAGDTTYQQLLQQIQHPGTTPKSQTPQLPWQFVAFVILALTLTPFGTVAMAAATARVYRGEPADFRDAYRIALRHWLSILLMVVLQIAIIFVVAFAGGMGIGIASVLSVVLLRTVAPLGVIAAIFTFVLVLAWFWIFLICYLACAFAFNAIGIEDVSFGRAVAFGFGRIFNRFEIGRATLIVLALVAAYIGMLIVGMMLAATLLSLAHVPALYAIAEGLVSLLATAFFGILIAVYYFDVRVRREGLDLEAAIERLETPATT